VGVREEEKEGVRVGSVGARRERGVKKGEGGEGG